MVLWEQGKIKRLQAELRKLRAENNYFKSPLFIYELLESINGTYSIQLNPPPIEFKTTTPTQKATFFRIIPNDIVSIHSEGKTKWIYFQSIQESVSGARLVSQKLSFTGRIDDFCRLYDSGGIHLCQISRSVFVNPSHYFLDGKKIKLINQNLNPYAKCDNLPISTQFIPRFIEIKSIVEHIISFQKKHFRGK